MATKKKDITPATTIAVISLGGKQFVIKEGDKIESEKLSNPEGETVKVDQVLLVSDGVETKVGAPFVDGALVTLKLDKTAKGEKVEIRKFKAKSRYRRSTGHRQTLSYLTVSGITLK